MPDYPIVDTHLHIWDTGRLRYPCLDDVPLLNHSYLIGDYRRACGDVAVEKTVFLQAEVDVSLFREEADWVSSVAAEDPRIEGIVAWAPLENGEAAVADLADVQMANTIRMVERCPDVTFILDHIGKPDIKNQVLDPRKGEIKTLSEFSSGAMVTLGSRDRRLPFEEGEMNMGIKRVLTPVHIPANMLPVEEDD